MLHSIHAWLIAGTPPNYVYLAGLYALTTFVLLKIPKVRANTIVEAIFNAVNPYVMPLVSMIPILGPLLAKLLGTLDTPTPHEKMELPKGPALLLPLAFLSLLAAGCDWHPIDPHTGLSVVLIGGALLMARALALRSTALALVLVPMLLVSGCASGADGARQCEANANAILGGGYRASVAFVKAADADAITKAQLGKDGEAQLEFERTKQVKAALFRALDTASDGIDAQDAAILGYEAAKKKDYSGVISALIRIGSDIVQAFADNGIALKIPVVK